MRINRRSARAEQSGVQNVLPVGGGQHDDALVGGKAVHLHQQLVQGLLPLIVSAAQTRAALTAHGVDLVNEHNGGGLPLGLVEQVPDPGRAHAHVQLHEVGAGDGQKPHPGLPGHRAGQEGFAGARRAHQQHALGDAGPQVDELLRFLQKVHQLLELLLLLVGPGHVCEGDGAVLAALHGTGPAKAAHAALTASAAPLGGLLVGIEQHPDSQRQQSRHHAGQQHDEPQGHLVPLLEVVVFDDAPLVLLLDEAAKFLTKGVYIRQIVALEGAVFQLHGQRAAAVHHEADHLLILEQLCHAGIADLILVPAAEHGQSPQQHTGRCS